LRGTDVHVAATYGMRAPTDASHGRDGIELGIRAARPRSIVTIIALSSRECAGDAPWSVSAAPARGIRSALDAIIRGMTQPVTRTRPTALAVWLIIAGAIGG